MLRIVCLSFIVLPELVKHILVAAVVERNVKVDGKMSNVHRSHTRVVVFCGGCRYVDARGKYFTIAFQFIFVITVLQSVF